MTESQTRKLMLLDACVLKVQFTHQLVNLSEKIGIIHNKVDRGY